MRVAAQGRIGDGSMGVPGHDRPIVVWHGCRWIGRLTRKAPDRLACNTAGAPFRMR
jgi:hypothetical protein